MTKADNYLEKAISEVGLTSTASAAEKYSRVYEIVDKLRQYNDAETISVGTTGTITDRICEWALASAGTGFYYRLTKKDVKWLGDYGLAGYPLNVIVSVKSFKAKERLLMSGTGSQLVPTIGYGLFDDASEFSAERLVSYRMRGFLAIYMPKYTLNKLGVKSREFINWNATPLIRAIEDFPEDLRTSFMKVEEGSETRLFVDPVSF